MFFFKRIKALEQRVQELETRPQPKNTISQRTAVKDTITPSQILDEWLNGEDNANDR